MNDKENISFYFAAEKGPFKIVNVFILLTCIILFDNDVIRIFEN